MRDKIIAFFMLAVMLMAVMPSSVIADDGAKSKFKVGDKVIFSESVVGTIQSIDTKTNRAVMQSSISAPVYLADRKTTVKTDWITTASGYRTTDNLFDAIVTGNTVTVSYLGKKMSWTPEIMVNGKVLNAWGKPEKTYDKINSNYGTNTLSWTYDGMFRRLRQIEGVLMDMYVLICDPGGDVVINENAKKDSGFNYDREAWAVDANNKRIPVTYSNGVKIVKYADLKDAAYPVTIDPTTTYTTSSSDGRIGNSGSNYSSIWTASSGGILDTGTNIELGQFWSGTYYIFRDFFYFDTSSLGSVTISSASLSLYGQQDNSVTDFNLQVQSGQPDYPHDPLTGGDYLYSYYSGNGGTLNTSGFTTSGYNTITLNATGISWINKTGTTKLCVRNSYEIGGTIGSYYEWVNVYCYEQGTGYRPKLEVTYTASLPTIQTDAASSITGTTATLNGQITATGGENSDNDGFVWATATHGDPGNVAPTSSGYSDNWTQAGSFGIGSFSHGLTGLSKGQTYYFRAFAHNSTGYAYGAESSFTTIAAPTVASVAASAITTSTVRLNAYLTASGGQNCTTWFAWGTTDKGNSLSLYDSHSDNTSAIYQTGDSIYYDVTGLDSAQTYYFNVGAANTDGGSSTGASRAFVTDSSIGNVSNLSAVLSGSSIILSWTKGSGSESTVIRYMVNSVPTDNTTGTLLYNGSASTYTHTGVVAGNTYGYWVNSYSTVAGYGSSAKTIYITYTANVATSNNVTVPGLPTNFLSDPDSSKLEGKFIGDPVNQIIAQSLGMPIDYLYFGGWMAGMIILAFVAFSISKEPIAPAVVCALAMAIGGIIGIVPGAVAWIIGIISIGVIVLKNRSVI